MKLTLPNYKISTQIYESADSLVYQGVRNKDNQPVILKMLKEDYSSSEELTRYHQEYEMTKSLNLDGVLKTYAIEKYKNTLVIVLEDFGGESLKTVFSLAPSRIKSDMSSFLSLAIQIADSLGQIHATNIIHKDINPANIVWNQSTNQLKIIDFSIASRLPRENPTIKNPEQLEGTLAYISPEQTGRMNRSLDYRTDLYSLGVTFYELLTGKLPFESSDALELVHCHIAKMPTPVCQVNLKVPQIISDIVMKLMAKNVEDRYQSAFGVKVDLEKALENLHCFENLRGFSFPLAQNDFSGKFKIHQKLYGRENEVKMLLQAFERVATPNIPSQSGPNKGEKASSENKGKNRGRAEMMLITGYSGVGKTALVREVYKPMTEKHGYFASGKFDQFQRNIPYSAISQAFNEFCNYLLAESSKQLNQWRKTILKAVGPNGQVLIDVIPQLALIIGQQPAVVKIGSQEAQNRFNLVFQSFLKAICQADHPLILFIDDLQCADLASLTLLKTLMLEPEMAHLLIIGAYRNNEVDATHPFMMIVEKLKQAAIIINSIEVFNLSLQNVNALIADALNDTPTHTQALANLIYQKTHGNAFFTTEFLTALYAEGLLVFDFQKQKWQWTLANITSKGITNNVVDFMTRKINQLPHRTINMIKRAACIGNQFDLKTLSIISEGAQKETLAQLWPAVEEGLLLPIDQESSKPLLPFQSKEQHRLSKIKTGQILDKRLPNTAFKFQHDRIQQAAYSLIIEEERALSHWKIGQLLLKNTPPETLDTHIFDIVNHLNLGMAFIQNETQKIVQLNLLAVKKAKLSTAFQAALKYARIATSLLNQATWQSNYALAFELFKEQAEAEYLTGHHQIAEELIDQLLEHAQSLADQVDVFALLKTLQATQGKNYAKGLSVGLQILQTAGLNFPDDEAEQQQAIAQKLHHIQSNPYHDNLTEVVNLATMHDEIAKVKMKLCIEFWEMAFYNGCPNLMLLCSLNLVDLSWQYGNTNESSFSYLLYGVFLTENENYQSGYDFGQLALQIIDKFNDVAMSPKVRNLFCNYINYHRQPFSSNALFYEQNIQKCRETGEIVFGVWAAVFLIWSHFLNGTPLDEVYQLSEKYLRFVENTNDDKMLKVFQTLRLIILNLQGKTPDKCQLKNAEFEIEDFLAYWQQNGFLPGSTWYAVLMGQILFIHGDYVQAVDIMKRHAKILTPGIIMFPFTQYYFYYSLNIAACYEMASSEEQALFIQELIDNTGKLKLWAENGPDNFQAQYLLVNAEYQRIVGEELAATEGYEQAIIAAKKYGLIQLVALANEIAARFWLKKDKIAFAQLYLSEAYVAYQQWGTVAKVQDLTEQYPQLFPTVNDLSKMSTLRQSVHSETRYAKSTQSGSSHQSIDNIDLSSLIKASQILSEEIVLSRLLEKMMHIVIENAGAEKGFLLLPQAGACWFIEAEGYIGKADIKVLQSISLETTQLISENIVNYVAHTKENVLLHDATRAGFFMRDPNVIKRHPKSILCAPLVKQGQLTGILYLENNLTTGAFTPASLEVLKVLSSQLAISIENALLYRTLEQKVEERTGQLAQRTEQLAQANQEITGLNEQLKTENLRMSAELNVSRQLQKMLLPTEKELEQIDALDIAGFMEPADEIGGDYYDVLQHNGRILFGIGDVTGHGLESGALAIMVQSSVRTLLANNETDPVKFFSALNQMVFHNVQRMNVGKSLTLALVSYQDNQLYLSGQHEEMIVVRNGELELIDTLDLGFPIGLDFEIADFVNQAVVPLNAGDVVVLYTDGITEAENLEDKMYGLERLCEVIRQNWQQTAQEIQKAVINDVRQFIGKQKVYDDITLLVLKQQ
ncbi:MAG: SpoIIE family protein phosphatase [Candidatus Parabeggiatoa sp.]|nr:SpoIIE family protein phosphatase [Candidatus Parabeggiatoa sp.]